MIYEGESDERNFSNVALRRRRKNPEKSVLDEARKAREINLSRGGTTGIKCKHKSILVSSDSERQKWCIHSEKAKCCLNFRINSRAKRLEDKEEARRQKPRKKSVAFTTFSAKEFLCMCDRRKNCKRGYAKRFRICIYLQSQNHFMVIAGHQRPTRIK